MFPINRLFIIIFFAMMSTLLFYMIVQKTKLGLLIRSTVQDRETSSSLGVPTRRVDGLTFALGTGLAGLQGASFLCMTRLTLAWDRATLLTALWWSFWEDLGNWQVSLSEEWDLASSPNLSSPFSRQYRKSRGLRYDNSFSSMEAGWLVPVQGSSRWMNRSKR